MDRIDPGQRVTLNFNFADLNEAELRQQAQIGGIGPRFSVNEGRADLVALGFEEFDHFQAPLQAGATGFSNFLFVFLCER